MRVDFSNRKIVKLDAKLLDQHLNSFKYENEEIKALLDEGESVQHIDKLDVTDLVEILVLDKNFISKLENLDRFAHLKRVIVLNAYFITIK